MSLGLPCLMFSTSQLLSHCHLWLCLFYTFNYLPCFSKKLRWCQWMFYWFFYFTGLQTTFFFDIYKEHFEKALDIFAHFFISPLFLKSSVDREIMAVDNGGWFYMNLLLSAYNKSLCHVIYRTVVKDLFLMHTYCSVRIINTNQWVSACTHNKSFCHCKHISHCKSLYQCILITRCKSLLSVHNYHS